MEERRRCDPDDDGGLVACTGGGKGVLVRRQLCRGKGWVGEHHGIKENSKQGLDGRVAPLSVLATMKVVTAVMVPTEKKKATPSYCGAYGVKLVSLGGVQGCYAAIAKRNWSGSRWLR